MKVAAVFILSVLAVITGLLSGAWMIDISPQPGLFRGLSSEVVSDSIPVDTSGQYASTDTATPARDVPDIPFPVSNTWSF
ncbi:hypothetical protein ABT880_001139 [Salmonella enterica subsp. enterica serovar Thompson]|nr:hypothetical protein [Salmonella enterica]ECO1040172.1 hypothetical protein [Salmonella enterica subsp. enterica serovar Newport]EDT1690135.1 hypothetical protein [Salmonella enterica subsp. enterica serovar Oslo]ECO1045200.1 hypothetical protein [Salmonella enterica subsp. enterica serovar Newport]EDH9202581.1 hypothetical protein [Salmonella enterica subsp. enterica serovar Newport]